MAREQLHECTVCGKTYNTEDNEYCPKCGENEEDWEETRNMLSQMSNNYVQWPKTKEITI